MKRSSVLLHIGGNREGDLLRAGRLRSDSCSKCILDRDVIINGEDAIFGIFSFDMHFRYKLVAGRARC